MKSYHSNVVGLAYEGRGEYIQQNIAPGALLTLQPEPANAYDRDAITVLYGRQKIGYAPARSRWLLQRLLAGEIQEVVAGNLEYDEFGIATVLPIKIRAAEPSIAPPGINLGIHRPKASDNNYERDENYLPEDISVSPVIFRAHPIGFIVAILLIPLVLGVVILLLWWLDSRTTKFEINRHTVKYETGIFSKDRRELGRGKIRTVRVQQSFLNRILNVGTIEIYTAGDKPEIVARDMSEPNRLRQILNEA